MEAIEDSEANVREMVERKKKKKKRERKKSEDDSCVGLQDTHGEAKPKTDDDSNINSSVDSENGGENLSATERDGHKGDVSEKADTKRKKKKRARKENGEGDQADTKRKKKKRARKENGEGDLSLSQQENLPENVEGNIESTKCDETAMKKLGRKKKHKKEKKYKDDSRVVQQDTTMKDSEDNGSYDVLHTEEIRNSEGENASKRKKTKIVENGSDEMRDEVEYFEKGKKKKIKLVENGPNDPTPNKSDKKVRFSGENEVFTLPDDSDTENENDEKDNLVRGKRFTREEDEIVKEAVFKYIEEHDLGDEGLNMVLNSKKYPKVKGCWKEIGSAIPYRPYSACYFRAQVIFRRSENRKWTQEEYDEILKYQAEHGNQWRALADELGKHRWHVKDTWRRIKLPDLKKGNWSQEEYQKLFDLVNTDLQLKVSEEKRSKHGMLRDNICWTAISDRLSTRSQATCCLKWYQQLTSPMVAEGIWADTDDYRILGALYSLDATCMEDVDWDDLLDDRTGDVCRRRWNQMVLHIGNHGNKSFAEQVEVLAHRYCPHLLEAREAWDSKPRLP